MDLVLGSSASSALLVLGLVGAYFLPVIVAAIRKVPNVGSVAVVNLLLGWTFIGWVVALAMAARSVPGAKREHKSFRLS